MRMRHILRLDLCLRHGLAGHAAPPHRRRSADKVIKVGTLKLIHAHHAVFLREIRAARLQDRGDSVRNARPTARTRSSRARSISAPMGLPLPRSAARPASRWSIIGAQCNRGMAVVAGAKSGISSIKDLKGKKVAILPGSTQEVVILERLKLEGMTIKDIQPIRVPFTEMPAALERGDIDAYVGAEPGPSISVAKGVGKIVEYPYSTPTGSVNMVMTTHRADDQGEPGTGEGVPGRCTARPPNTRWPTAPPSSTWRCRSSASAKGDHRNRRAQRRADLEHRRRLGHARQVLRLADARQEADPPAAGLRQVHRHAASSPRWRRPNKRNDHGCR